MSARRPSRPGTQHTAKPAGSAHPDGRSDMSSPLVGAGEGGDKPALLSFERATKAARSAREAFAVRESGKPKKPPRRSYHSHLELAGRRYSIKVLAISLFAVLALIIVAPTFTRFLDHQHEVARARSQLADAKADVGELERELALWNDEDYVKAQARERLGYVMPGQTLYVVTNPEKGSASEKVKQRAAEVAQTRRAATPWFATLWDSISIAGRSAEVQDNPNSTPLLGPEGVGTTIAPASTPPTSQISPPHSPAQETSTDQESPEESTEELSSENSSGG